MTITALVGLCFSIIAIRLMMIIESRQSITNANESYSVPLALVVCKRRSIHKLTLIKFVARVLSKVSMAIFCLQGLSPEYKRSLLVILPYDNRIHYSDSGPSMRDEVKARYELQDHKKVSQLIGGKTVS
jgi:hypothetical protein